MRLDAFEVFIITGKKISTMLFSNSGVYAVIEIFEADDLRQCQRPLEFS